MRLLPCLSYEAPKTALQLRTGSTCLLTDLSLLVLLFCATET